MKIQIKGPIELSLIPKAFEEIESHVYRDLANLIYPGNKYDVEFVDLSIIGVNFYYSHYLSLKDGRHLTISTPSAFQGIIIPSDSIK